MKTNKIYKIALMAKFQDENIVETLLEIAEATDNIEVALEKLLGVYAAPEVPTKSNIALEAELVNYNPFKDLVTYSFKQEKTRGCYVPKNRKDEVNKDNYLFLIEEVKELPNDQKSWVVVKLGEFEQREDNCSLSRWTKDA